MRKCAHNRSQECPYKHLVESGRMKCDVCIGKVQTGPGGTDSCSGLQHRYPDNE